VQQSHKQQGKNRLARFSQQAWITQHQQHSLCQVRRLMLLHKQQHQHPAQNPNKGLAAASQHLQQQQQQQQMLLALPLPAAVAVGTVVQ
jgi:hypothetical protein